MYLLLIYTHSQKWRWENRAKTECTPRGSKLFIVTSTDAEWTKKAFSEVNLYTDQGGEETPLGHY